MGNVDQVLPQIVERIKRFRNLYEQNEMAVRNQIINPILGSLGWNPENPEEVQPNVSTDEGVPDYCLIKNARKMLFLEAKKLSVDVEQREVMRQLAKYSFAEGTKYGILTNGGVWMLLRSFEEGTTLVDRVVWKADLENEEASSVCRKLVTIARDNVEDIEGLVRKLQILNEVWQSLLDEPEEVIRALVPVVRSIAAQGYPGYAFEDAEIEGLLRDRIRDAIGASAEGAGQLGMDTGSVEGPTGERPQKMKLGAEVFELRKSLEILVNTANWLVKKGKLRTSDCPVGMGHKRNLVNTEPKHKYGDEFRAPKKLSNGLWLETHLSTAGCINNARRLLERFGFPANTLVLE